MSSKIKLLTKLIIFGHKWFSSREHFKWNRPKQLNCLKMLLKMSILTIMFTTNSLLTRKQRSLYFWWPKIKCIWIRSNTLTALKNKKQKLSMKPKNNCLTCKCSRIMIKNCLTCISNRIMKFKRTSTPDRVGLKLLQASPVLISTLKKSR